MSEAVAYHRTSAEAAAEILRGGFRDTEGTWATGNLHRGVWVTLERPWDLAVSGAPSAETELALIVIEIPEAEIIDYEWIEEGKGYREALVPAEILNRWPHYLAWECDGCGAVAHEAASGWRRRTQVRPWPSTVTICGNCDEPRGAAASS
ncbi:MAG: hypothetical protein ACLGI5_20735 [Thermoleophilia bacterium]